ncbi:translation initiation factor IF-2 N-terminal domain-containing protein, partial [Kocuria sp. HSID17582]
MAKPRVHELAKELGITSKEAISKLQELGEFVRGASSTVEPPVAKKLRSAFPAGGESANQSKPAAGRGNSAQAAPSQGARKPAASGPKPGGRTQSKPETGASKPESGAAKPAQKSAPPAPGSSKPATNAAPASEQAAPAQTSG